VEEKLEAKKEERDKEVRMKREVRILKEEDKKKVGERQARQEKIKKMYIIEKEIEQEETVEKIKSERDKLIRENQDRHRQQSIERQYIENAVGKILHMTSPRKRERYLLERNFDQALI
jgi:hypothetical protein